MRILLITPPMVQVNAPYPATAYLAGRLKTTSHQVIQADAALMLALRLFSRSGLIQIAKAINPRTRSHSIRHFLKHKHAYTTTIEPIIRFLQGKDPTLAWRIASRQFLPEGPRFKALTETHPHLPPTLNPMASQDFAIHLASLYLDDLTDTIRDGVDPRFELAKYGEKLAASAPSFDGIAFALQRRPTLVDLMIDEIVDELMQTHHPELVGLTLPFPGNVYAAFRIARRIKKQSHTLPIVMGGGYINTELRSLSDPRVFDYTDYITLDDGEIPLLRIIAHLETQKKPTNPTTLERTFVRRNGQVRHLSSPIPTPARSPATSEITAPQFSGLPLEDYFSMIELPNPMHKIWSCGRWNKLTLAHGCYWHRCAFCDTSLEYIHSYKPTSPAILVSQIEEIIRQTGQTGFHFVDEAMPPALLRELSKRLIKRNLKISWWGNIRFDKAFTPELAALLAKSGCIAVTGGLEAANDRLLTLLDKGFKLDQVTRVTHALSEAGILVHAYLMYGCPSQTCQDTVDSLEYVRQLFEANCIQSAYWHRFALTIHSPIFNNPSHYRIRIPKRPKSSFANNEIPFIDPVNCDHETLGRGLRKSLYNYMHGVGLDLDLQDWFDTPIPPPTLHTDFVSHHLSD